MKILLIATLAAFALRAKANSPSGYLLFEVGRNTYNADRPREASEVKQSFKIPLTEEFLSNFKEPPVARKSQGTGFYCNGGEINTSRGSTHFMWWIHRTLDHRWSVNMWAQGTETVHGTNLYIGNPSVSQDVVIKGLEDLDMSYLVSFENMPAGLNVSFSAKFVSAQALASPETIPIPPVQKADRSMLFKEDKSAHLPIELHCGFQ